jgi:hypothetical protein
MAKIQDPYAIAMAFNEKLLAEAQSKELTRRTRT